MKFDKEKAPLDCIRLCQPSTLTLDLLCVLANQSLRRLKAEAVTKYLALKDEDVRVILFPLDQNANTVIPLLAEIVTFNVKVPSEFIK